MSKKMKLIVFGSRETATLARFYFEHDSSYEVVAFTVDDDFVDADQLEGLPLVPFSEVPGRFDPVTHDLFVALSYRNLNRLRAQKYAAAKQAGYRLASYLSSKSVHWPDLAIGDNCFILENQTIQPAVTIGNNVMLWSGNHLGHGTRIHDHVYLASHVCLSGHCRIHERSFLGVNVSVREFCTIGDDCFIGMHAAVTTDVPPGSVVFPGKCRVYNAEDPVAQAIKRRYFGL